MIRQQMVKNGESICVITTRHADQSMLRSSLIDHYQILHELSSENSSSLNLIILDTEQAVRFKKKIKQLKALYSPVLLPMILLKDQHQEIPTELWDLPDDIVQIPVRPNLFLTRVRVMLQINQLSKTLESRNQRLKQKNRQLRLYHKAIEATNTGIVITDPSQDDNPIVFYNRAFEDLTGYSGDHEIMGRNCRFLQTEDKNQDGIADLRKAIENRTSVTTLLRNYTKDGTLFWNELSISPIKKTDGSVDYYVGIQNDVTSLVNAREELSHMLEQKETLLQEVHHRVKNNLALISGLIELQTLRMSDVLAVEELKKTRSRILSIAKVHEQLYQQSNLNQIDFKVYIENLSKSISDTYSGIDIELNIDSIRINIGQAIPLGLLLNELIINSVEHGFGKTETPKISIFIQFDGQILTIHYRDYGKGLNETDDLKEKGNFGMKIIRTLLVQLNAEWEFKSDNGLHITFQFPIKAYSGPSSRYKDPQ